VLKRILDRFAMGGDAADESAVEEPQPGRSERRFAEESIDGHQEAGEPDRMIED
jgi:hypothetical protein